MIITIPKLYIIFEILPLINLMQILPGTQVLLSSDNTFIIPPNKCKEIIIANNFKKLNITLISSGISELLLTDHQIEECTNNNSIVDCCPQNSTYCMSSINPFYNYFYLYYCLELSYIYACSNNQNFTNYLTLETNVIKGEGCQIAEYIDETECETIGIENCKNKKYCNNKCKYIECLSEKYEYLFAMCLPVNFTENDIMERCSNHINFGGKGKYNVNICINDGDNADTGANKKLHKSIKIFLIFFGVISLAVFMSSIIYRFKIKIDINSVPFNPPWWCPNFIFPRINKTIIVY